MSMRKEPPMRRIHKEAMREEMIQAGLLPRDGQLQMEKGNSIMFIKHMIKSELQQSFANEQEFQDFIADNPQLEVNQRFGFHTERINVHFYERGYAEVYRNKGGYLVPTKWLDDAEIAQARKDGLIID